MITHSLSIFIRNEVTSFPHCLHRQRKMSHNLLSVSIGRELCHIIPSVSIIKELCYIIPSLRISEMLDSCSELMRMITRDDFITFSR
jgi:hypothetical protein